MGKPINIMTSCDGHLATQLLALLQSIADNLPDKQVNFYLLQSRIPPDAIDTLKRVSACYGNLSFHVIRVPGHGLYQRLADMGSWDGSQWCGEAYYGLGAYQLLPPDIDRVLCLDAGDTLVTGDIDDYYFADFEGKSLIATAAQFINRDNRVATLDSDDLGDPKLLPLITRGIFNSGSYVMNLERMRRDHCRIDDYIDLGTQLAAIGGGASRAFFGDQGLMSAAYLGDIKYFGYPQFSSLWHMPYNFCLWYFDHMFVKPSYQPRIVHFAGAAFKPWRGKYPIFLKRFQEKTGLQDLGQLKLGQAEYFYLWHQYAMKADGVLKGLGR